jgi:hypothetical protein
VPLHVSFGTQGVGLFAFGAWAWKKLRRQQRRRQQKFKVLGLDEPCSALIVPYLLGPSLALSGLGLTHQVKDMSLN